MKFALVTLSTAVAFAANPYSTYPSVPHTASINGFADPIYDKLPSCAKDCVKQDTGNTPCPYWDTGCFCYMPQWSGPVGECFVENCKGGDVKSATDMAVSLCKKVGATAWMIPSKVSTQLGEAAKHADAKTSASAEPSKASATPASASASASNESPKATGSAESTSAAVETGSSGSGSDSGSDFGSASASASASSSASSLASNSTSSGVAQTDGASVVVISGSALLLGATAFLL